MDLLGFYFLGPAGVCVARDRVSVLENFFEDCYSPVESPIDRLSKSNLTF